MMVRTVRRKRVARAGYKAWRERYHLKPFISVLLYLIIPLVSIYLIMLQYPLLAKERFFKMIMWIVPFGAALFVITLVQERYTKGTWGRLGLDAIFVGLTMCWLFGFLGGSTVIVNSYGGWNFSVEVGAIVNIALCGTGLNFVHDILEFMAHRNSVRAVGGSPDEASSGVSNKRQKGSKPTGEHVTIRTDDGV